MDAITPADFNAHLAAAKLAALRQLQDLAASLITAGPDSLGRLRELRLSLTALLRTPPMHAARAEQPEIRTPPRRAHAALPPASPPAPAAPSAPPPGIAEPPEPHIPSAAVDALIAAVAADTAPHAGRTQRILTAARTILARAGAPPPALVAVGRRRSAGIQPALTTTTPVQRGTNFATETLRHGKRQVTMLSMERPLADVRCS